MAIFRRTLPLIVTLAAVFVFLPSFQPFTSAAAAKDYELATQICKNTTDFDFCRAVVFPNPRAAAADRVDLAYIVFNLTYVNSTGTQEYIDRTIKSIGNSGGGALMEGLRKCKGYYLEASQVLLYDMLQGLDTERYSYFDVNSIDVEDRALACEKGFGGQSPMTKRNDDVVKLAKICYAVALLFPYGL